ncbi:hypothetical protein YC2023_082437 [Brassica napus]
MLRPSTANEPPTLAQPAREPHPVQRMGGREGARRPSKPRLLLRRTSQKVISIAAARMLLPFAFSEVSSPESVPSPAHTTVDDMLVKPILLVKSRFVPTSHGQNISFEGWYRADKEDKATEKL